MRKLSLKLILSLPLVGCVSQPNVQSELTTNLERVSARVELMEAELSNKITKSCGQNIDNLGAKIERLRKAKITTKVVERCTARDDSKLFRDKLLLGAVEQVTLTKEQIELDARIDTGADTSSIGVYQLKNFERDSEKWVRFSLADGDDARIYEYPIFDTVKIKQSGALTENRIEIKVDIKLGGKKYKKQLFNLANRGYLDYQLLIGRSFLRDIAIVDVSRKNLLRVK